MFNFNTFQWITLFAISAAIFNSIGIFIIYKKRKIAEKLKDYLMCFAAGVLISSPLILAFPQAIAKNSYAGFAALGGFLFMFFSNKVIRNKTKDADLSFGITAIEGIGIHSFIDGIIYTVTFSVNIFVGLLAGVGLVIHEFAEGVITYAMLVKGGVKEKKAMFYAFIIAALTTPIGAFLAYPFVYNLNNSVLGLLLGFVTGVLIYLSSSHLLPEARDKNQKHSTLAFLSGIALAVFMMFLKK